MDRPILFTAPMVNAILAGRKTQTRRIIKPHLVGESHWEPAEPVYWYTEESSVPIAEAVEFCPFGRPGDRLWVRETFGYSRQDDDINEQERVVVYQAGGYHVTDAGVDKLKRTQSGSLMQPNHYVRDPARWVPSIHMPRWASRITLEITKVRVEPLLCIGTEDAMAEGFKGITKDGSMVKYGIPDRDGLPGTDNDGWPWEHWCTSPRLAFQELWGRIYGLDSWAENPWVWVVEFRQVEVAHV